MRFSGNWHTGIKPVKRLRLKTIAASHTVDAAFRGKAVLWSFEYDTGDVSAAVLDDLLAGLVTGSPRHEAILIQGCTVPLYRGALDPRDQRPIINHRPQAAVGGERPHRPHLGRPLGRRLNQEPAGVASEASLLQQLPQKSCPPGGPKRF